MTNPDPKVEAFFSDAPIWQAELSALRTLLLGCGLHGNLQMARPGYCFEGGNVAILWGFKDACDLGVFQRCLAA